MRSRRACAHLPTPGAPLGTNPQRLLTRLPAPPALRSNQGGIKGALAGAASEKARGRIDNVLAELQVPVQVRGPGGGGGGGGRGGGGGAGVWVARLCEPRRRCTRSSRATSPTPPLATLHQVFMATQDDDFRKPGRGMWDFFVEHCNAGVEPDLRCAGTAAARVRGRAQPHAPTVRGTRRVLDLLPACPPGRSQSFFVGDAAGRPTDIGDGSDSDKCAQAAPSHARLQQPYP